jgi:dTDP-4-dehydrorhamnose reductase
MPSAQGRIVLTGAGGQLGQTLVACWPDSLLSQYELIPLMRSDLDIADAAAVHSTLDALQPALIINAAAYTAVDKAESEAEAAFAINERGVTNLAVSSTCPLIHLSTDFVFDGAARTPYAENAATAPLSVYGKSKLAGEKALLAQKPDAMIIRTSWLYSEYGTNFVKTMLRLMSERDVLSIVHDQIGSPTSTHSLAAVVCSAASTRLNVAAISKKGPSGIFHWSDGASITWFDFALEIQTQALALGLLKSPCTLKPIPTSEYPTPAARPLYSVMSRVRARAEFDCPTNTWQAELTRCLLASSKV